MTRLGRPTVAAHHTGAHNGYLPPVGSRWEDPVLVEHRASLQLPH